MKREHFYGYEIHLPTSGGKAGKHRERTSTIQVRRAGFIVKQFRYTVADADSRVKAMRKAREYCCFTDGLDEN